MQTTAKQQQFLAQLALVSTLFVTTLSHADTLINTPTITPLFTSVNGPNITVTQTGDIVTVAGKVPITIDSANARINLLEGNNFFLSDTIQTAAHNPAFSISIIPPGVNSIINIAPVASIGTIADNVGFTETISITAAGTTINNAGLLHAKSSPPDFADSIIHVFSGADNTSIFNNITGQIVMLATGGRSVVQTDATSKGFVLQNLGLIETFFLQVNNLAPVILNGQFDLITNSGLVVQAATTGSLFGGAILIHPDAPSGDVINTPTGIISFLNASNQGNTILITGGSMSNLINQGVINNLSTNSGGLPNVASAIFIDGTNNPTIDSIQNVGRIWSTDNFTSKAHPNPNPTIQATVGATITNGLINTGDIINENANDAIDFSAISNVSIINAGNIVGNVRLGITGNHGNAEPVFTMTGGVITGAVISEKSGNDTLTLAGGTVVLIEAATPPGTVTFSNTYNLLGGTIIDRLLLPQPTSGVNVVNLAGTKVDSILGSVTNDIFNITGGSFVSLDGGNVQGVLGGDVININNNFITNGQILNVPFININNASTFIDNNIINLASVFKGNPIFTINPGSSLVPNNIIAPIVVPGDPTALMVNNFGNIIVVNNRAVFDFSQDSTNFPSVINNLPGGVVTIGMQGILRILGNNDHTAFAKVGNPLYINTPGSIFSPQIFAPWCAAPIYGQMIVDSFSELAFAVNMQAGSFIQPTFMGFMPANKTFDIITVHTGGNVKTLDINNQATLIPYPSALVYFTAGLVLSGSNVPNTGAPEFNSLLRLTSHRNSFESLTSTDVTPSIAFTLDSIANTGCPPNFDLYLLLSEFDQIPTQEGVELAMESLLPPFNYGLIAGSHMGMDSAFEAVTDRTFELAWRKRDQFTLAEKGKKKPKPSVKNTVATSSGKNTVATSSGKNTVTTPSGKNTGDNGRLPFDGWVRVIGGDINQSLHDGIDGYDAKGAGLAIGVDVGINDGTTYGMAMSYTNVNVHDKNWAPKNEHIKSWQGTFYGAYDFSGGIFLDAMVGLAHNKYNVNRTIHVNNFLKQAQSSFYGTQLGAQGDLGMVIPIETCYFAPFVRLKYINLRIDQYTETGVDNLNLAVTTKDAIEFLGGAGVRAAKDYKWAGIIWVPEIMAMLGYDFHNDGEETFAGFLTAGPAFSTLGVIPGKTIFDVGLALNTVTGNSVLTAKYNLEVRNQYVSNAGYLQYTFSWF